MISMLLNRRKICELSGKNYAFRGEKSVGVGEVVGMGFCLGSVKM
jgi:hypothetical protein